MPRFQNAKEKEKISLFYGKKICKIFEETRNNETVTCANIGLKMNDFKITDVSKSCYKME
jgi:hypothetical protein